MGKGAWPIRNVTFVLATMCGLALSAAVAALPRAGTAPPPSAAARKQKPPEPPPGNLPPPPGEDTEPFDPADAIPRPVLRQMYQRELGSRFKPALEDKLYAAHLLVEKYFGTTASKERKAVAAEIEKLGLDPNLVGRITRIRMDWPELAGGGVYYVNQKLGPHQVQYFLGVPKAYDRTKPWPLVIKLPTAHGFAVEPPPSAEQVVTIYRQWMEEELAQHPDAVVLMPRLHLGNLYGPGYAGMNSVIQPMRHAYERVNLDPARVYLIGHSMSGHAVWNLSLHYPTYFAAINPLAGTATGDWQRLRLMNLRNVLPVVWHDADDTILKVNFSRQIVKALRQQLKFDVEYEETKGVGHTPTAEVAERAYQKLTARERELYPPEVLLQSNRGDTIFNRNDWVQVWQPLNAGKEQRLLFRGGMIRTNTNAHSVRAAKTKQNRLEAAARNVATLRFYVNDQMIDFREPVTVVVNKKARFEGTVKPSIEEMLKDQLFLGRGWRYYTGVIDIDLAPRPAPATQPGAKPPPPPPPPPSPRAPDPQDPRRGRARPGPGD